MFEFERFRSLFARYQNLNLITLLDNLRENRVAFKQFLSEDKKMCPIKHGLPRWENCGSEILFCNTYGVSMKETGRFILTWDCPIGNSNRKDKMIALLESILKERMDDADAMQTVLTQPTQVTEEQLV